MSAKICRFAEFELDRSMYQLRRDGLPLKLERIPLDLLFLLIDKRDQLVTRDEIVERIWGKEVFLDADNAINSAIRKIRRALRDSHDAPLFIQTVPTKGYRFVAEVKIAATDDWGIKDSPSAAGPSPIVVGREMELARLAGWSSQVSEASRRIVFVAGEAGIGKTTFVKTFLDSLPRKGMRIGLGQCIEQYGAGEPYMPVFEALIRLCRGAHGDHVVEVLHKFAPDWLIQMPSLLTSSDRGRLQGSAQLTTQKRMLLEMAQALEALASELPLVIVIEDLHWADFSTLELISTIARRTEHTRMLIVGTYRPTEVLTADHPLRMLKHELELHRHCEEVQLKLLGEEDVVAYLAMRFAGDHAHAGIGRLAPLIHQRTEGNPLFMVNVVDYLVELGLPREANKIEAPRNILQMIECKLERLSPDDQLILEAASVAGTEFSSAAVAVAVNLPTSEIEAACARLSRREQFIAPQGISEWPDGTVASSFRFRHGLYSEALYERIPAGHRTACHRRIAARLEAAHGERASEIAAELANHYVRGADRTKAVKYLRLAGVQAGARAAHQEAIAHFEQALEWLQHPSSKDDAPCCSILLALATERYRAGDPVKSHETLLRAADLAHALGSADYLASASLGLVWLAFRFGLTTGPAYSLLEEALGLIGPEDSSLRAKILAGLGTLLGNAALEGRRAIELGNQAIAVSRRIGDKALLAENLSLLNFGLLGPDCVELLLASVGELEEFAHTIQSKMALADVLAWKVLALFMLGDTRRADAENQVLERLGEETQQPFLQCLALIYRAARALMRGQFAHGGELATRAFAVGQGMRAATAAGTFSMQMFALSRERGELKPLEPVLQAFIRERGVGRAWRPGLAMLYAELGRMEDAERELHALALHDFKDLPRNQLWLVSLTYLADVCLTLGDKAHGALLYELLQPYAGRNAAAGIAICHGSISRYLGALAGLLEIWDDAERYFDGAMTMNAAMEAPPLLSRTRYQYAAMLFARGRQRDRGRASALLDSALAGACELGMRSLEAAILEAKKLG